MQYVWALMITMVTIAVGGYLLSAIMTDISSYNSPSTADYWWTQLEQWGRGIHTWSTDMINSLTPGKCEWDFREFFLENLQCKFSDL